MKAISENRSSFILKSLLGILFIVVLIVFFPHGGLRISRTADLNKSTTNSVTRAITTRLQQREQQGSNKGLALTPNCSRLLRLKAFELDTGEVSPKLLSCIGVDRSSREHVDKIVRWCVGQFKKVESENSELISSEGQYYVRLSSCEDSASYLFQNTKEKLSELVGDELAVTITSFLRSQLRNGGKDEVEIGFVKSPDNQYLLSVRTLDSQGTEISLEENVFSTTPNLGGFFRWEHLQRLYAGEDSEKETEANRGPFSGLSRGL